MHILILRIFNFFSLDYYLNTSKISQIFFCSRQFLNFLNNKIKTKLKDTFLNIQLQI
jgi:hypothetical protein